MKSLLLVACSIVLTLVGCADGGETKNKEGLAKLRAGDCVAALTLFTNAENAGEACAPNNLGVIYAAGCPAAGLAPDPKRALGKYEYAAGRSCAIAFANAGDIYARGVGIPQDQNTAIGWYLTGARWGNTTAISRLQSLGIQAPDPDLMNQAIAVREQEQADRLAVTAAVLGAAAQSYANTRAVPTPQPTYVPTPQSQFVAPVAVSTPTQQVAAPQAIVPHGCHTDLDCGIGKVCLRAQQQLSLTGTCVTPVNSVGTQLVTTPQARVTNTNGCSYDTQCGVGFQCLKQQNELYGICVK